MKNYLIIFLCLLFTLPLFSEVGTSDDLTQLNKYLSVSDSCVSITAGTTTYTGKVYISGIEISTSGSGDSDWTISASDNAISTDSYVSIGSTKPNNSLEIWGDGTDPYGVTTGDGNIGMLGASSNNSNFIYFEIATGGSPGDTQGKIWYLNGSGQMFEFRKADTPLIWLGSMGIAPRGSGLQMNLGGTGGSGMYQFQNLYLSDDLFADSATFASSVYANAFIGDGSGLTGLVGGWWDIDVVTGWLYSDSHVGIGIANPSDSFHVVGTVQISETAVIGGANITNGAGLQVRHKETIDGIANSSRIVIGWNGASSGDAMLQLAEVADGWTIRHKASDNSLRFSDQLGGIDWVTVSSYGNIGVGLDDIASDSLEVAGGILADSLNVKGVAYGVYAREWDTNCVSDSGSGIAPYDTWTVYVPNISNTVSTIFDDLRGLDYFVELDSGDSAPYSATWCEIKNDTDEFFIYNNSDNVVNNVVLRGLYK